MINNVRSDSNSLVAQSAWLKTKCMTESEFVVVGMEANPGGAPFALLAREEENGLVYAGSAFSSG